MIWNAGPSAASAALGYAQGAEPLGCGIKTLSVPVDVDADATGEVCTVTGEPAAEWTRFARTY